MSQFTSLKINFHQFVFFMNRHVQSDKTIMYIDQATQLFCGLFNKTSIRFTLE